MLIWKVKLIYASYYQADLADLDRRLMIELAIAIIVGLGLGLIAGFAGAQAFGFIELVAYLGLWILSILGIFVVIVLIIMFISDRLKWLSSNGIMFLISEVDFLYNQPKQQELLVESRLHPKQAKV